MYERTSGITPGKIIGGIALFLLVVLTMVGCSQYDRVDAGYVGIMVDYSSGQITEVPLGRWQFVGPYKRLIKYPTAQIVTIMDRDPDQGDVKGDDSVLCPTRGGVITKVDATVWWQPNQTQSEIINLYLTNPGVPLHGTYGSDINSKVVRRFVTSAIGSVCGGYAWEEVYSDKKNEVQAKILEKVTNDLKDQHLVVNNLALGNVWLPDAQSAQAAQLIDARQKARVADLEKAQVEAQAAARRAQVEAQKSIELTTAQQDAKIQQTNAERDAALAKVNADRDSATSKVAAEAAAVNARTKAEGERQAAEISAQAKRITADADAYQTETTGAAKARAESALSRAYTAEYLTYLVRKAEFDKWNGNRVPENQVYIPPGYQVPGAR